MRTKFSWLFSIAGSFFAAGCTLVEFDQLVPQSAISDIDTIGIIQICKPTASTNPTTVANKQANQLAKIQSNTQFVRNAIPQIGSHPVVNTVLRHVQYISASSIVAARHFLSNGQTDQTDQEYLATVSKPPPLAASDIARFGHTLAETVMRNTGGNPDSTTDEAQQFWSNVKAYYTAYYKGDFVTYFAQPVSKPTVQLTISDAEITAAGVFLELLFDQLLSPTVWIDSSKNYYPGAGSKPPTYLSVFKQTPAKLVTPEGACGMTEAKANTIAYLANTFSTAASGELSVGVKSFGGIQVGLGILGKLSIGDNSTLTALLQSVASEAVKRLTVAIAAPILEAIEVVPPSQTVPGGRMLAAASAATSRARKVQLYSSPFTSATRNTL